VNLYDELPASSALPALSSSARQLLTLSAAEREDARLLGLLAQRDPVLLARLLSLANSAGLRRARRVGNAHEAVTVLGTERSYALLLASAQAMSFEMPTASAAAAHYLLQQAVSVSLTAQRLTRLLHAGDNDADPDVVFLATLLDVLGLHVLLATAHPRRDAVQRLLTGCAQAREPLPLEHPDVRGWRAVSVRLARRWESETGVIATLVQASATLETPSEPNAGVREARLLALAHELVAAKLRNAAPAGHALTLIEQGCAGAALPADALSVQRMLELALVA
jgi:HD-like signal output (HDOD) protein